MWTRREILASGIGSVAALSLAGPLPRVFGRSGRMAARRQTEKILVVLQLTGGNDGLNTLIPFADDEYYRNRFTLAVPRDQVLKVGDYAGMHPSMKSLNPLLEDRRLAFVQGVGYPLPNRSHFESMDFWHTAHRMDEPRVLGWLGRVNDLTAKEGSLPSVHLGSETQPLALTADQRQAMSIRSINSFRLQARSDAACAALLERSNRTERTQATAGLQHTLATMRAATEASRRLSELPSAKDRGAAYPRSALGEKFRQIADLIAADIPVRVYYVSLEGFDTHANQNEAHASLLREMADGVGAFVSDLITQGNSDRVLVMTFSEFGRRVKENGSRGTDHGAASIVQLAGPQFSKALLGTYPSLSNLDDGDLKHSLDYRQLYAGVLRNWLDVDPASVLAGHFDPLELFS